MPMNVVINGTYFPSCTTNNYPACPITQRDRIAQLLYMPVKLLAALQGWAAFRGAVTHGIAHAVNEVEDKFQQESDAVLSEASQNAIIRLREMAQQLLPAHVGIAEELSALREGNRYGQLLEAATYRIMHDPSNSVVCTVLVFRKTT